MKLSIKNDLFIDKKKRSIILRGVNLGGSTKVPFKPNGATHIKTDFSDHHDVSFIGRPFPLNEADEHLARLKKWGFNCLRLLTTWEAIEHEGPGKYDQNYLKYLQKILEKINDYEFYCFIDPHQDVWSRVTGGDGAPLWTFEKVGLDYKKFNETEAAFTMQAKYPDEYAFMSWSSNYTRFASATMFTLFFAGNDFAPGFSINKQSIQDYLQEHFINSIKEVAKLCVDLPYIIGYDIFNEPNCGFLKFFDLRTKPKLGVSLRFNGFEAMATASGCSMEIPYYEYKGLGVKKTKAKLVNPNKISCWLPNARDIWKEVGIWKIDKSGEPVLLKSTYFHEKDGKKVNFFYDYLHPFINKFSSVMQKTHPGAIIFVEFDPFELMEHNISILKNPQIWTSNEAKNVVNASHWYDGPTLYFRRFFKWFSVDVSKTRPVLFSEKVKKLFIKELQEIKDIALKMGNCPTLIGETGIPFDFQKKKSYRTGNFREQINALTMHHECFDKLLLNYTLWNYSADNNNEWGDLWNLEDFSIFSKGQQKDKRDLNSGARALEGFCRPFAQKTAGKIQTMAFNKSKKHFSLEYENDIIYSQPTEVFVPKIHYPNGFQVRLSDGKYTFDEEKQTLFIINEKIGIHKIDIYEKQWR